MQIQEDDWRRCTVTISREDCFLLVVQLLCAVESSDLFCRLSMNL
jgi:hypothetical protein